jgi:hypothetical protein
MRSEWKEHQKATEHFFNQLSTGFGSRAENCEQRGVTRRLTERLGFAQMDRATTGFDTVKPQQICFRDEGCSASPYVMNVGLASFLDGFAFHRTVWVFTVIRMR